MQLALITALGVGGSTIIGVLFGFLFQKIPHEFNDVISNLIHDIEDDNPTI